VNGVLFGVTSLGNRYVLTPQCAQEAATNRVRLRVSPHAVVMPITSQAGILQSNGQCECVINVIADVGVDDDGL